MKVLVAGLVAYALYAAVFFVAQRRLIYPGTYLAPALPERQPSGVQRIWLTLPFGRVEAWFLGTGASAPGPAVLFAHGNGEVIDHWADAMQGFSDRGVAVLMIEYPGYGRSDGSPSQGSITAAFEAGFDWLVSRDDVDRARVFAMGRSLGGGVAAALSRTRPLAGLVMMSTFVSIGDIAWRSYFLPGFLALDPYDNRRALRAFRGPVLIVHGTDDRQIPYRHAEALAAASPGSRLVPLTCGHNDCPPSWPEFVGLVDGFIDGGGDARPTGQGPP